MSKCQNCGATLKKNKKGQYSCEDCAAKLKSEEVLKDQKQVLKDEKMINDVLKSNPVEEIKPVEVRNDEKRRVRRFVAVVLLMTFVSSFTIALILTLILTGKIFSFSGFH